MEDQQALMQGLNDLVNNEKGIDEVLAKRLRKSAADMIAATGQEYSKLDPKLSEEITTLLATLHDKTHQQAEQRDADFAKVLNMLDQAEQSLQAGELQAGELQAGELQAAEKSVHAVLSILGTIPSLSDRRRQQIDQRLSRIQPQMRHLESWRHWGTSQARADLIAQIQFLVGSELHPNAITKTINEARIQWQDWDKGGDHSKKKQSLEFDQACKEAFKPCKAYFDERKKMSKQALQQKRAIIDEVNQQFAATDWSNPDYKAIDQWLRSQRREFFKIENTPYKQRKAMVQALDDATLQFAGPLSRERKRCYKTRQKLLEEMQALQTVADSKAAIEQLEAIKKQWVVTVIEKHGLERKLWKQYQAACDAVYNKRKSARKEQDVQFAENLQSKNALLDKLGEIAALAPLEALKQRPKFLQLLNQYREIAAVPRQHEKSVLNRFKQIKKQFDENNATGGQTLRAQHKQQQFSLACLCDALEQAVITQKSTDDIVLKWQDLSATISAVSSAPADLAELAKLTKRFDEAIKAVASGGFAAQDLANNLAQKQSHCLKLEVCYDMDSPQEFRKQRMAYQIERLSAAMKKNLISQEQPEQLISGLLSIGAVAADQAKAMAARIELCFNRHLQA